MYRRRPVRTARGERGQAIVEYAIVFPIQILLTLCMIQLAYLFVAKQVVSYAAFCAARAALVYEDDDRFSAGDEARGRAVAWQGALVGVSLGLVMLGLIPLSGPIMDVMAGGGRTGALGGEYFGARLWGVVAHLLSVACFGWFEGRGQTALPMVVRVMTNVLNVCLDAVLIFGLGPFPEMGVKGAAVATVFALVAQAIVAFALLWHRTPSERVSLDGMSELFRIGGPMGVQWALEVQSWALFSSLVARVGDARLGTLGTSGP